MKRVVPLAVAAVALVLSSEASAQAPACPASAPQLLQLVSAEGDPPPNQAVVGRSVRFAVARTSAVPQGDHFWHVFEDPTATFIVNGQALWSRVVPTYGADFGDPYESFQVQLDPGAQTGEISLSWNQEDAYNGQSTSCRKTASWPLNPVTGRLPRVSADWDLYTERRQPGYYTVWEESVVFEVKPAKPPELAAGERIVVKIRGGGKTRRLVQRDQLDENRTLRFTPSRGLRGKHRFRYNVSLGSKVIRRGDFNTKFKRAIGDRLWLGADAFINKCLGTSREVRSRGGRLFCWDYHYPAHQDIRGLGH